MKSNTAVIEMSVGSEREERNSPVGSEVREAGPLFTSADHLGSGLRHNWVSPWLKFSNSAVCPYLCAMGSR